MKLAVPLRLPALALVAFVGEPPLAAQVERYEVGRRVRAFERAFEGADPATRAPRSLAHVKRAVRAFFALSLGEAGRHMTRAQRSLAPEDQSDLQVFADALHLIPRHRLLDRSLTQLDFTVRKLYPIEVEAPAGTRLAFEFAKKGAERGLVRDSVKLARLPFDGSLKLTESSDLPEGTYELRAEIVLPAQAPGSKAVRTRLASIDVSLVDRLEARLREIEPGAKSLPDGSRRMTARFLLRTLKALRRKPCLETDYPALKLLTQLERDVADGSRPDQPFSRRAGEHWLAIATGRGRRIVRVLIPDGLADGARVPVVLALHGAGGSENMFFDTYGDGLAPRLAVSRGWIFVAPRGVLGSPSLPSLVAELAKVMPVDSARIVVVGHSMGGGRAAAEASACPLAFRAVSVLGGGGRVAATPDLLHLPFFIGAGKEDFGRPGAIRLHRALQRLGCKKATYREYKDIEHLLVVQVALPDVFAFFDRALKPR